MNFKSLIYTMGISGLLVFSLMSFLITTQSDNDVSNPLINNTIINKTYGDLNLTLKNSIKNTSSSYGNFSRTPPTEEFGELQFTTILSIINTGKVFTLGLWNILVKLPLISIGFSAVVANVIGTLLLISIVIGIYFLGRGSSA